MADSYSGGIAGRYATAAFEIAREADALDDLERDAESLLTALDESPELRELTSSPVYTREEQERAIGAVAERMGLGQTLANTLRLMATKRRLFAARALARDLRERIAEHRGEVTAEVVSAHPLSDAQQERLARTLESSVGSGIKISASTDPSLIGGMIVRVGSKMIDTSIRSKLSSLEAVMRRA